jgi:hypothetical protein
MGRGAMAAFYKNGQFDASSFGSFLKEGSMGFVDMAQNAATNLADPAKLISYQANQSKILSEAGKKFGGQAPQLLKMATAMQQAKFSHAAIGGKMEDHLRKSLIDMGTSEPEIETMLAQVNNSQREFEAKQLAAQSTFQKEKYEHSVMGNVLHKTGERVSDFFKRLSSPAARSLGRSSAAAQEYMAELGDSFQGVKRVDVSGVGITSASYADIKVTKQDLDRLREQTVDINSGAFGGLGGSLQKMLGKGNSLTDDFGINSSRKSKLDKGDVRIGSDGRSQIVAAQGELEKASKAARNFDLSDDQISEMSKTEEFKSATKDMKGRLDKLSGAKSGKDAILALTGKDDISKVTASEAAAAFDLTKNMKGIIGDEAGDYLQKMRKGATELSQATGGTLVHKLSNAKDSLNKFAESTSKRLGLSSSENLNAEDIEKIYGSKGNIKDFRAALYDVAESKGLKSDKDISDFQNKLGGLFVDKQFKEGVVGKITDLKGLQQLRSEEQYKKALVSAEGKLTGDDLNKLTSIKEKLGTAKDLVGLGSEDVAVLEKGGMGALAYQANTLKKISASFDDKGVLDKKKLEETLSNVGFKDDMAKSFVETASKQGKEAALDAVKTNMDLTSAGTTDLTGGGGGDSSGLKKAEESLKVSTDINSATLAIMQQLFAQIKDIKR